MALSQSQLSEVTKGRAKDIWSDVFWDVFCGGVQIPNDVCFFSQMFVDVFVKNTSKVVDYPCEEIKN